MSASLTVSGMKHGCKRDFPDSLGLVKDKRGIEEPGMQVPVRKFDDGAREVGLVGKGDGETAREGSRPCINPDFPIDTGGAEGEVITRNPVDARGADHNRALKVAGQNGIGIAVKQGGRRKANPSFMPKPRKHLVDCCRSFRRGEDLGLWGERRDRGSVVIEIKGRGIPAKAGTKHGRALEGNLSNREERHGLPGEGGYFNNAARPESERFRLGKGGAHALEHGEGIGINRGSCCGMQVT